ncbi:MAG: hypothetical protein WAW13_00730 [Minisyncoccia bacterium]
MANILSIDGKEYTPATIAGKHFEYTKDYMLLLIKRGNIDGRKIGNKWYVHIPSAEVFFKKAKEKRSLRRVEISQTRKAELKEFSKVYAAPNHRRVLIETFAVLIIALSVGGAGYMGTVPQSAALVSSDTNFFKTLAVSLYTLVSPGTSVVSTEMSTPIVDEKNTALDEEANVVSEHTRTATTATAFVVAPEEVFTATSIEAVKDSFSDEVEVTVDPQNPETGIITPIFKKSEGEAYRFLMVPVKVATP